jgi:hypothetical protein
VNDNLSRQLEEEKIIHKGTSDKLAMSDQIIEQMDLKIKRQEEQIKKLQQQNEQAANSKFDAKTLSTLKDVEEDSLVMEVLNLRQQLAQEKAKLEEIDVFLSKAKAISSTGRDKSTVSMLYVGHLI